MTMRFLPIFVDMAAGPIMIAGASHAALNKLRLLREAGANVRWFPGSTDVAEEVAFAAPGEGLFEVSVADPLQADLAGFVAVISAIGAGRDEELAARVRARGIPMNVVDRPELSTFIFPAIVDRGDVVVAVGTGGNAPVLARRLREKIEAMLPARIGELSALVGRYRGRFSAAKSKISPRVFWEHVIDGPIGQLVLAGRASEAEERLAETIDGRRFPSGDQAGIVFLVGAGPGDPDLLTLRASQILSDADIVFHDDLVSPAILDRIRRDAERVFVGKRNHQLGVGQDEINRRLAEAARQGKRVVRLKGGDPFIFGRGGEELDYLREADIPVVVVPGVTAALGCAAQAGLPLTFRNEATHLSFLTAHRSDAATAIDWTKFNDPQTTLVVYMGLQSAAAVRQGLIAAGRSATTPAAVLARGTCPDARSAVGVLDDLPALAAAVDGGPALLVIGAVVARSDVFRDAQRMKEAQAAA